MTIMSRVSFIEKLMFTKHMYIMMKSGVPISDALDTLADHAKSEAFRTILLQILKDIENGKSFHEALGKHPKVFDNFYTNLIKVSEQSGTLEETLNFLSVQLQKDYALRQKIKGAMFYPMFVLLIGLAIGAFISLFILPQLVDFFEALDVELPVTTKMLLWFANLMQAHGILIFVGIGVAFFLFRFLISTKHIKPLWHKVLLKIPLFGKLISYSQLSRFCRNFGTLLQSGVPAAEGLNTTADTMGNLVYTADLREIEQALISGKNIGDAMDEKNYKEFPSIVIRMIRIGEKTGNLEEVLMYLSEFYEDEIDSITKSLTTILEPFMLITIGLMVGFVALAIIGPIYKLTGSIG